MSSRYLKCSMIEPNSWLSIPSPIPISVITNTIQPVASVKSKHPLYFFPVSIPSPSQRQIDPTFSTYSKCNHVSPFPLLPSPLLPSSWPGWLQSLPHWILCCHPPHSTHMAASLSTLRIIGPLFHFTELRPRHSCQASSLLGVWHLQLVPALDMPNCAFNLNSSSSENDQQILSFFQRGIPDWPT